MLDVLIQVVFEHHPVLLAEVLQNFLPGCRQFRAALEAAGAHPGAETRGAEGQRGTYLALVFEFFNLLVGQVDVRIGAVIKGLIGSLGLCASPCNGSPSLAWRRAYVQG